MSLNGRERLSPPRALNPGSHHIREKTWGNGGTLQCTAGEGRMRDGGGEKAGGKVKGTSSAHCWGLENGCGAEEEGMKHWIKEPHKYLKFNSK